MAIEASSDRSLFSFSKTYPRLQQFFYLSEQLLCTYSVMDVTPHAYL